MSVKVLSENAWPKTPKWPKGVKIDTTGYTEDYLAAKSRVSVDFVTLDDGRKICYFTDGDASGVPMICLHGGGESKWMFLQKQPVPGAYMIAVDRPGYGESDSPKQKVVEYTFDHCIADIAEVATKMGFETFVLCGFSIGTSWSQQIAAALPNRVRGLILFGTMADTGHKDCTKKMAGKIGKPPSIMNPNGGCLGFILRGAFSGPCKAYKNYDFRAPMTDDWKDKRCHPRFNEWIADPFWVQMKVDDHLGFNRADALLGDAYRSLFGAWTHDVKNIKCPVFIYSGEFDADMGSTSPHAADFVKQCVPHAVVEFIPGCGHASTFAPTGLTQEQIVKALKEMPPL